MLLKELVESGVIYDQHEVTLRKGYKDGAPEVRKGKWYEDRLLAWSDMRIGHFDWNDESVDVILVDEVTE